MSVTRRRERRRTAADWTASNEVLLQGEWGIELSADPAVAHRAKIGDGVTAWNALPYYDTGGGGGGAHADLAAHDALGLATQAELVAHAATSHGAGGVPAITVPVVTPAPVPVNLYHGAFWPVGVDLGPFHWEAWVRHDGGEYWISEGFGGAHAILAGFGGGVPTGNVYNGSGNTSFSGAYVAQVGEWLHYSVIWDGAIIWVLINGIVCGRVAFAGPRRAQFGDLFIGGSDHSNFHGAIAQIRAWEGQVANALPYYGYNFAVERHFNDRQNTQGAVAQVCVSYLEPAHLYPDVSGGFWGQHHPGVQRSLNGGVGWESTAYPTVQRVVDPTAPFGNQMNVARTRTFTAPTSAPVGAKIWDSFGRADSIPAFVIWDGVNTPATTLGSTEAGSLGVLPWEEDEGAWGIFDGAAVSISVNSFTRVPNNSADMDVRVSRYVNVGQGFYYVAAAARVNAARTTGWYAHTVDAATVALIRPDGTTAGSWAPAGAGWTLLRVLTAGTTITVYVDDGSGGWTQLGQVTGETANQAEVGAGKFNTPAIGTQARYTTFEVR